MPSGKGIPLCRFVTPEEGGLYMTTLVEAEPKLIGGKYRVVAPLGTGAMGVVYRAEQLDVEKHVLREVALKTLRPELSCDPDFSKRFMREVRVSARLRNPHTVTVYDSGIDDDGQLFYTMEIIQGRTLKEVMQASRTLPFGRVVRIVSQICEALGEAHGLAEPIVHRDIKPANIFLEEQHGVDWVKVGDFGIAKVLGEEASNLSHTGVSPGTPRYMAPEQWRGEKVDARSDLYALGVMIYEMLTGGTPFSTTDGPMALMYQHLQGAPRPLPLEIPVGIRLQVERLLAKAPEDRPANALQLRQALEQALTGEDEQRTIILPAGSIPSIREPGGSTNGISASQTSASLGSQAASLAQSLFSQNVAATSSTTTPRSSRTLIGGGLIVLALVGGGWWYRSSQLTPSPEQQSSLTTVPDPSQVPSKAPLREIDSNLITAARSGSSDTVGTLITQGANVNAQDAEGQTALMVAAGRGATGTVQLLLSKKADVNAKDNKGRTALLWATSCPPDRFGLVQTLAETVQFLMEKGADITVSGEDGRTPLMWAAMHGYDIIVRTFVAQNVPVDAQDKDGNTALLLAVSHDHIDPVRVLLTRGAAVDLQNAEGKTALMAAANANYLDITRALLAKQVDVNLKDKDGRTALMLAVNSGSLDIVQTLLAKGADPKLKTVGGRDALMIAALKGQTTILPVLLEKGADINATDEEGKTALMWAVNEAHLQAVQLLLAKGASMNTTDNEGRSALVWAAAQDRVDSEVEQTLTDIVKALLAKNADTKFRSGEGKTALHWAAEKGHFGMVQALLAKNVDATGKDWNGKSPLMLASTNNHADIVDLLATAGRKSK